MTLEHTHLLDSKISKLDKNIAENQAILEHVKSDAILEEAIKLKDEAFEFIEEKIHYSVSMERLNQAIIKAVSIYEVIEQDYSDLSHLHKNLDNKYYKLNN